MSKYYSIKELENFSGIKAHTIRIWEKRYDLLNPSRTNTNIRLYDSFQLRKLLNVAILLQKGYKISKISRLHDDEIFQQVENYLSETLESTAAHEPLIEGLVIAAVDFDENRFEKIFSTYVLRYGLKDTMVNLIYPFMHRIGMLWGVNKVNPAQEHFVSNLIRQKLFVAIDGSNQADHSDRNVLLFLPSNHFHELGLLFANYLLRQQGCEVCYLGTDVPLESLSHAIQLYQPSHIFTFLISSHSNSQTENYIQYLLEKHSSSQLCIAGNEHYLEQLNLPKNVLLLKKVDDLFQIF